MCCVYALLPCNKKREGEMGLEGNNMRKAHYNVDDEMPKMISGLRFSFLSYFAYTYSSFLVCCYVGRSTPLIPL
jgi:hypothetical protein